MISKRDRLATYCGRNGVTRLLELLPTRPVLLVLNYDVRRFAVSGAPPRFKFQTALAAVTGRYWF